MADSQHDIFPNWRGDDLDATFVRLREVVEDPDYPTVRRWRENGGKVLGHFQVYFPEELADAAGLLPVKIRGSYIDAMQADSRFGSYLCSILKTSLELALSDRLQLDLFVSHPICDAARNLAAIWERNLPYPSRILYLPQNPNSSFAQPYLRDEYARMMSEIEEIAGKPVDDDDLRRSIALFNQNRALMRQLYALKREQPWLISADEAYVLVALAGILPRTLHNEILTWVLEQLPQRENRQQDRVRVVFEGAFCEQPPLELIRLVGRSCYVVDDDFLIGLRWIVDDIALDGDPLTNLAGAYLEHASYSPVQHDTRKPKERMLLERIQRSGANAAIITAAKMCEPGLEEQVTYTRALDEAGIPYFVSEFQETMTSFEHLELQLETFVENILFE